MRSLLGVTTALLWTLSAAPPGAADGACGVYLLERDGNRVALRRVPVPEGETVVIPAGPGTGVIGPVFPPGPGVSSGLEQAREDLLIVLRCVGDRVRCEVRSGGRVVSGYPERSMTDLSGNDIRVSVVGGDGRRWTFLIRGYREVVDDGGPVQNLFAGAPIPLGPGDHVVTTDTYPRDVGAAVRGEAPVDLAGHAFVRVTGPGGNEGWFVLDTGAAETVVSKSFLADTARIEAAAAVEYSAAGRRLLDYAPPGATGPVLGVLGHARLSELRAGGLVFEDVVAAVLPRFPDFFGRPVEGIIGLDLLRRAASVTLEYPEGSTGRGTLRLGPAGPLREADATARFALVSGHPVFPARIGDVEVFMILDTGAPGAVLDSAAAVAAGLASQDGSPLVGLGGQGIRGATATIGALTVGGRTVSRLPCRVGALDAFRTLREGQHLGLFGNALVARFERLELDFGSSTVRFSRPREPR